MGRVQEFATNNVVRLEVEDDPTGLVNLIQNPSGELGGFGWVTPLANTRLTGDGSELRFETTIQQPAYFLSELLPVAAGTYVAGRLVKTADALYIRARYVFTDVAGAVLSSSAQTGYLSAGEQQLPVATAPPGTENVQLRIDVYRTTDGYDVYAGSSVGISGVVTVNSATSGELGTYRKNLEEYGSFEGAAYFWSGTIFVSNELSTEQAYTGTHSKKFTLGDSRGVIRTGGDSYVLPAPAGGKSYAYRVALRGGTRSFDVNVFVIWYDDSGASGTGVRVIGYSEAQRITLSTTAWQEVTNLLTAPTLATRATLRVEAFSAGAVGDTMYVDQVLFEQSELLRPYFDGSTAAAGGFVYAWEGTPYASTSTAIANAQLDYIAPISWLSIMGGSTEVKIERTPLDVCSITAKARDVQLDPSQSETIRPGKRCRVSTKAPGGDTWEPLITAQIRRATVNYDLRRPVGRQALVELTATDAATKLANVPRSEGVATIAELPAVLEGAGVPWSVNGSGDQVIDYTVVARNESASVLDQVGLTRDSSLGQAWIDRTGVLQVWDADQLPATISAVLTEADYTDAGIDYDTDRCINIVQVVFLRIDPDQLAAGESSEEVTYGPYSDDVSVRKWGPHSKTFTIQWADEDPAAIEAFAQSILTANATPAVRVNSVTLPIRKVADLTATGGARRALIDLLDLVYVSNGAAGLDEGLRVRSIAHTITATRWDVELGFAGDGQVATPASTPAPASSGAGQTLGEKLRPVGEVTEFYGSSAAVPSSWLVMNGQTYDTSAYPKLYVHLGTNVLPDFRDRVSVGASVAKAVGSTGGIEARAIAVGNLPAHAHTMSHDHGATGSDGNHNHSLDYSNAAGSSVANVPKGTSTNANVTGAAMEANGAHTHNVPAYSGNTGSVGSGTAFSVMQPYVALHKIIRAR